MIRHGTLCLFLVAVTRPASAKELFQLGLEVTDVEVNACRGKYILSCHLADVDLFALQEDSFQLPGNVTVFPKNVIDAPMARSGFKDQAYSVAYEGDGCEAVISVRNGKVFANFEFKDGSDFVLEPCRAYPGCHVWKEEDVVFMDEEQGEEAPVEMDEDQAVSDRSISAYREQGINDDTTIVEISVKYYYTKEFAAATDDIELYFDQVIAETNQGYINSNIPVRVKIFCIEATTLNDESQTSTLLNKFAAYKGSYASLLDTADAAALMYMDSSGCGRGTLNSWGSKTTFTVQAKDCALGYYTMGHELGHNFGGTHDRGNGNNAYYSYGYGGYIEPKYRSIMAYHKTGYSRRVNYYSSPSVFYNGEVTGSETEDNARVIKENRFGFAAVGEETGSCGASQPVTTEEPATTVAPATGLGECQSSNSIYSGGVRLEKAKRKTATACQRNCVKNGDCTHWIYYHGKYEVRRKRKQCFLMSGEVTQIISTRRVTSGKIASCV